MAELFGKYQLHEKIAQGGMAEVFLASKEGDIGGFKRRVAIKRMFPHLVDRDEIITMFIDEARIASQLHHPNIVQIYDLGVVDGTFFIAMEFVEGYDLRQVCKHGVEHNHFLSRPLAVHIISEVAVGLHYAHTQTDENDQPMNIVHRDISPQNVLISVDGVVKICDFGIAKAEDRLTQTQIGEFKGKFSYMSPEQFASNGLDHRSDIFALGIVLYETTVGARLFKAPSEFETIRRITEGDFSPPSSVRPNYPKRLEEIIMKALQPDPDDRYQTAAAMQDELEKWLFDQRVRVGGRQLSEYLTELMDEPSPQAGGTGMGELTEEPTELGTPIDVESDDEPDPTVELGVSEEERRKLLEIRGGENQSSENADPTINDLESEVSSTEELQAASRRYEESVGDDFGAQSSSGSGAVEVRRVSSEEGHRRRRQGHNEAGAEDRTLVDEELEEDTTSPVEAAPGQVRDARSDRTYEGMPAADDGGGAGGAARSHDEMPAAERGARRTRDEMSAASGGDAGRTYEGMPTASGDNAGRSHDEFSAANRPSSGAHQVMADEPAARARDGRREHAGGADDRKKGNRSGKRSAGTNSKGPTERSADSLVAEVPDLTPGGRQLTGLNEMRAGDDDDSPADALSSGGRKSVSTTADGGDFDYSRLIPIGGGVLVAVVFGIALTLVFSGDDDTDSEVAEQVDAEEESQVEMTAEPVGDREIQLELETEPRGASVVVNGELIHGKTPLEVPLVDERDNDVWITRRNHRPQQLLIPADGTSMQRTIELERASATDGAGVDFHSTPPGADVYVNGELFGKAPFRMENVSADFEAHVQFEHDGFRPFVTFVHFDPDEDHRIDVEMTPEDDVAVRGSYEFRPSESRVLLAGEQLGTTPFEHVHHRDEWLELEVTGRDRQTRQHRLRLDRIGGFRLGLELEREARETGHLSVEVEPMAAVYVDARALGGSPLDEVELPAGEQRVVFETQEGTRVRVPLEIEANAHRKYRVVIDGDDADVELVD